MAVDRGWPVTIKFKNLNCCHLNSHCQRTPIKALSAIRSVVRRPSHDVFLCTMAMDDRFPRDFVGCIVQRLLFMVVNGDNYSGEQER